VADPVSAAQLPPRGQGYDRRNIYVGVATEQDASTIGATLGADGLNFGNQRQIVEAAIADFNKRGGAFGRKIVGVFYDVSSTGDPEQEAAQACATWTQDHKVISASLVDAIARPSLYQCLNKAGVAISTGLTKPFVVKDVRRYLPGFSVYDMAAFDRFADPWLDRLQAMGYFSGWNTAAGAPGSAPVKVGILYEADEIERGAWTYLKSRLEKRGLPVPVLRDFVTDDPSTLSGAVLRFQAEGVTHVFLGNHAGLFYPPVAESQHFRARYAVSSMNLLQAFMVGTAPEGQLHGMMGVGWEPSYDVQAAQDGPDNRSQRACLAAMRAYGAQIPTRNARYVAFAVCDGLNLLRLALGRARGLAFTEILSAEAKVIDAIEWAAQYDRTIVPGDPTQTSAFRDIRYDQSCSCTRYSGPVRPIR
jgi:ABC-type branched-subunit amino acid transport system substrate-binding protein